MEKEDLELYAEFLAQCRELLGPFDIEKLASDPEYKAAFIQNADINPDDQIFKLAKNINRMLEQTKPGVKFALVQNAH
jgi:hypothetical protein